MSTVHSEGPRRVGKVKKAKSNVRDVYDVHHDARYLTLPTLNIMALVLFAIVVTYQASSFKNDLEKKIEDLQRSVNTVREQVTQSNATLEAKLANRWQRLDMLLWCKETEAANPKWKCGPLSAPQM